MGLTTDFVIAEISEAKAVLAEPSPVRRWPGVEAKSIDTIRLSTLASILAGKAQDVDAIVAYSEKFLFLASTGDNERHVLLLPEQFVRDLAIIKESDLARVAKAWLATEEFQMDREWTEKDVLDIVRHLRGLASDSVRLKKPILLQWSP
jgi:hypothetical protein